MAEVAVPVPQHADYLLSGSCRGVGVGHAWIDVRPEWKRAESDGDGGSSLDLHGPRGC